MGQVVILEGPDGGGKTTFARALEKCGFEYKHEGPPPPGSDIVAHYLKILDESINAETDVVHDRLWLGERIYGPVARGTDLLGNEGQRLFMRLCDSKNVLQYICLPPKGTVLENYKKKIQDPKDFLKSEEKLLKVYSAYLSWTYSYGNVRTILDYTQFDYTRILGDMELFNHGPAPKGMVGSRKAKFLFIGDRPNHDSIDVPFHALNGSSGYFNTALTLAGLEEHQIAISNAYSPLNIPHSLGSMLIWLPSVEHIFLMGQGAQAWYNDRASQVYKTSFIPHPSYLKRFKGSNPQVLADIIKERIYGSTD
jgi:hypothetical protein